MADSTSVGEVLGALADVADSGPSDPDAHATQPSATTNAGARSLGTGSIT